MLLRCLAARPEFSRGEPLKRTFFAVATLVLFAACSGKVVDKLPGGGSGGSTGGGSGGGAGGGGGSIIPPISLPLPKTSDGKFVLIEIARSRIDLDPTIQDPLTALGGCTDLITNCYDPSSNSLDSCVVNAKTCETAKPWEALAPCCPAACADAYATLRNGGTEELAAFDQVFFQQPDCFPGVTAALGSP